MKKYFVLILTILLSLFTMSCSYKTDKTPNITVYSGKTNISYTVGLNEWNGSKYDREDTFISLIKGNPTLPYIKLGEKVQIEFVDGSIPDSVKMLDLILNPDGRVKYTQKEIKTIPIQFKNRKAQFILDQNIAALLSSNSKDYEPGVIIRGFRLICSWGDNECEYAFIIKCDAIP